LEHPDVEDRNTGLLSVVPDAPEEPAVPAVPETVLPKKPVFDAAFVSNPMQSKRLLRGIGLAVAFAGLLFLASEYLGNSGGLRALTPQNASNLSSFIIGASLSTSKPPVLFADVEESWELLSEDRRREEAENVFATAEKRWGAREGFLLRGDAVVAQRWGEKTVVYASLHGEERK
jgi:hypothetical protein